LSPDVHRGVISETTSTESLRCIDKNALKFFLVRGMRNISQL
jgi:hypothetical protein